MFLYKHFTANNVKITEFPFPRELSMEAYVIENENVLSLGSEGFNEVNIISFEQKLLGGRESKKTDGRIDILANYGNEYLAIVELKLGELNDKHLE